MKRNFRKLTCTTAIVLGLAAPFSAANAQPFAELDGVMLPPCGNKAETTDAGTLGADAFGKDGRITAEMVLAAHARDEVCINGRGKVKLRGESAAMAGDAAEGGDDGADTAMSAEQAAAPEAEVAATESPDADATPRTVEELAEELLKLGSGREQAADPAPTEEASQDPVAEQPQPTAEAEPEQPPAEADATAEAEPEQPPTEAEATAEAEQPPADAEATAEAEPEQPEAEAEVTAEAPVAAAADENGRSEEAAQVTETTVTEENSRSSSEEFATPEQNAAAAASGNSNKGLSNFEKFALGGAGIIALDAIIGNNREVVSNSGDRVILRDRNGDLEVLRDDDTLLRRPGSEVKTETFSDGSTRTTVTRRDGAKIVTIADATGRVIKRTRIGPDGHETLLIDDTEETVAVDVSRLPTPAPARDFVTANDRDALQAALRAESRARIDRSFSLRQVRQYREVRDLMPEINIDAINFRTGSAAIEPEEADELLDLGRALSDFIRDNPDELFLVEGHTDAVGDAAYNLALSDRRAESVALALTEYFQVPPENMIIQGYGESELLVPTSEAEQANRRAVVRRVTPLLR